MGLLDSDASSNGKPVFYGTIKTKDLPAPVFVLKNKDTGVEVSVKSLDGNLIGVDYTENEYEGNKIRGFRLKIDAPDGVLLLSIGFTSLGRNIINSLLSLTSAEDIKVSLYKNKKDFDAVSVTQWGQQVQWKHSPTSEEMKPVVVMDGKKELLINGKKVLKWETVQDFLIKEMNDKFIGTGFSFATPTNDYVAPATDSVSEATDIFHQAIEASPFDQD